MCLRGRNLEVESNSGLWRRQFYYTEPDVLETNKTNTSSPFIFENRCYCPSSVISEVVLRSSIRDLEMNVVIKMLPVSHRFVYVLKPILNDFHGAIRSVPRRCYCAINM